MTTTFDRLLASFLALVASVAVAHGQQALEQRTQTAPAHRQGPSQALQRDPAAPDDYRVLLLIRSTIMAFNHANQTGNYTVLRDLGTPAFQSANTAARLAEIFAPLRARKVDLAPVLFVNPKLSSAPALQEGEVLRLTGFFPTAPEQVHFDLAFEQIGGQWLLSGIAVNSIPASEAPRVGQTYNLQAPTSSAVAHASAEAGSAGQSGRQDAKPIRIDLSEPPGLPTRRLPAEKKPKPAATGAQNQGAAQQPQQPQQRTSAPAQGAGDADGPLATSPNPLANEWRPQ